MKKILLLAGLTILLTGCKRINTTSVNLSGTWLRTVVESGDSLIAPITMAQTSMNLTGDFTAKGTIPIVGFDSMNGNINSGATTIVDGETTLTCKGTFSNNYTKYVGHCTTPGSSDVDITMTKN